MGLGKKINSHLTDGLKTFKLFQRIIAVMCIGIPFFLWLDEGAGEFRSSISDYVYMPHSYFFGMLLAIAATPTYSVLHCARVYSAWLSTAKALQLQGS